MLTLSRTARSAVLAAAAAAALTSEASAQGIPACDARHVFTAGSYASRVCDVSDFDQRRRAATLAGDGRTRSVAGLAGDGGCHCVPTSFTNLLSYYAQKGVDVLPGAYPWLTRPGYAPQPGVADGGYLAGSPYPDAEITAYNRVTTLIGALGTSVKTGDAGCGTSFSKVIDYHKLLTNFGLFPRARFITLTNGVNASTPRTMAAVQAFGGTIALAYGRYTDYAQSGSSATATARKGGHAISLEGVSGGASSASFLIRDPASDEGNDKVRQSAFTLDQVQAQRISLEVGGDTRNAWRWGPDTEGTTQRVLDGWMALLPTYLVTVSGKNLGFLPGIALNRQDRPAIVTFQANAAIIDAAVMPSSGEVAFVTKGSRKLRAVSVRTKKTRTLGTVPAGVRDLEADPTGRRVFALGRRQVVSYSEAGRVLAKLDLPRPADAIAYNPSPDSFSAERLVAVSVRGRQALTLSPGRLRITRRQGLPASALAGAGRLSAGFDDDGRLQLRRGASGSVRSVGATTRSRALRRSLPGAAGDDGGLVVTDAGTYVTVRDGKTAEITPSGRVLADSPFTGTPVRGRVVSIARSGGDLEGLSPSLVLDERIPYDPAFPEMARDVPPPPAPQPQPQPQPQPDPQPQPQPDPPAKADLVIDAVSGSSATIRNAGGTDAGPFEVQVSGRTPQTIPVRGLAAGQSTTITFDCERIVERTLTVDAGRAVDEFDETNNQRRFTSDCRG